MSTVPTVLLTLAGALLVATAVRDAFDALFNETGRGVLNGYVMRAVWKAFRRFGRGDRSVHWIAGPMALVAVVATWGVLLIVGWALIYWPHMPSGFAFTNHAYGGSLLDSLYLSMVTLTTVGFGDVTPAASWLRLVVPLEALISFALLTASISWLLSIYPVLWRRRSLAYEIKLLLKAEQRLDIALDELADDAAEEIFAELTSRLIAVERDLAAFPVAYYFSDADPRFTLADALPPLLELAERGSSKEASPRVRLRATMLKEAIEDFASTLAERFHRTQGDTAEMLRAYALEQGRMSE